MKRDLANFWPFRHRRLGCHCMSKWKSFSRTNCLFSLQEIADIKHNQEGEKSHQFPPSYSRRLFLWTRNSFSTSSGIFSSLLTWYLLYELQIPSNPRTVFFNLFDPNGSTKKKRVIYWFSTFSNNFCNCKWYKLCCLWSKWSLLWKRESVLK